MHQTAFNAQSTTNILVGRISSRHYYHHHLSLTREGRWGTTDDFATRFPHLSLFSTALWDLPNHRPVHFLLLSSHLFLCLPCLLPPFTVPCKMVLARPDERETWPYHCSLHLFTIVRSSSCGPIACWILHGLPRWYYGLCTRCVVSCGSTSFPWLVFFFGALLWGSMIHKHTGRWMWQRSASVVSWSCEKYSCQSKLVFSLVNAAVACAILESISGLEASSAITWYISWLRLNLDFEPLP